MPFTPFHFGPGAAIHAAAPTHVSFLAFCGANVLVDVEPLYYILTGQFPLHRFFHTYVGVSLVVIGAAGLFSAALAVARVLQMPNILGWRSLGAVNVFVGAGLGGYSHVVLDSIMHSDIRPLAPFSSANLLYQIIPTSDLHWWCLVAGIVGLVLLGFRRGFSSISTSLP